jgi:antitoxin component YwqK of YwqJK toxin-antitoxin module
MKKHHFICYLFFLTLSFNAQVRVNDEYMEIERSAAGNRNNISSFVKVERNSPDGTTCYYFRNGDLVMATVREKNSPKRVEWHFVNGRLSYTESFTREQNDHVEKTYHHNGRMLAWTSTAKGLVDPESSEFSELGTKLQEFSENLYLKAQEEMKR